MRTTLTLDDDVAMAVERRRRELDHTLKQEVNDLLRAGLAHVTESRSRESEVRLQPLSIGRPLVGNFDDISAVLAMAEGESHR